MFFAPFFVLVELYKHLLELGAKLRCRGIGALLGLLAQKGGSVGVDSVVVGRVLLVRKRGPQRRMIFVAAGSSRS